MKRFIGISIWLICLTLVISCNLSAQDRRCKLYDLSKIKKHKRKPQSSVIQFYSSTDNIGNYLPILGIQQMLGFKTDVWCMHDKNIDFDFINKNYSCAIIGGAGLLNSCFEPFWKKLNERCTLPLMMWGLGICLPYRHGSKARGVSKDLVQAVAKKCDLINVRDILTARYYQLDTADISPCPTVAYLQQFKSLVHLNGHILYSAHAVSVGASRTNKMKEKLKKNVPQVVMIDNIQRPNKGLRDIILDYYCKSSLVITSRLHGAIIAYGLGIPCIMIPGDRKLDSFYNTYNFGMCVKTMDDCLALLNTQNIQFGIPLDIEPILAFGPKSSELGTCSLPEIIRVFSK